MQQTAGLPRQGRRATAESGDDRRSTILDAAYAAFVEFGFTGATTDVIAARARVSKRAIYDLFAGKADLFAAVVLQHRHLLLDLPRPANEDGPVLDVLIRIFRLDMDAERDRQREALLNLVVRESAQLPELSDMLYGRGIIRSREDLMAWIEAEVVRGRLAVDDPGLVAGLLMDVVFGALLPRRRQAGDAARKERKRDIARRLAIVLRGLAMADAPERVRDG